MNIIKKTIVIALLVSLLTLLAACTPSYPRSADPQPSEGDRTKTPSETHGASEPALSEGGSAASPPETHWAAVPAVFVNDTYFRIFADELYHPFPDLDDTWVFLGTIQSAAPGWEPPTQNFQTNNEAMIGAEIYFASGGRIPVSYSAWDDPIDEEVFGDSVIVLFNGSRLWYITEEAHSEVIEKMNAVERHSLMVDGVMYSLMGSAGGGNLVIDGSYAFLGEVLSSVPIDEFPTEHLQANRDFIVGMKVYRLPPGDVNDIIVFLFTDAYFFYKHLPGATESN